MNDLVTSHDVFRRLADSLSIATDDGFFAQLATALSEIMGVDYVMIAQVDDDGLHATTLALCARGKLVDNIRYPLAGTPCEQVTGRAPCHFSQHVCQRFPDDALLAELDVEAYLGVPMSAPDGRTLGLLAAMHSHPINTSRHAEEVMRIAAARAGSELARQESDHHHRQQLLSTNRALKLLSRCNEALIQADHEQQLLEAICQLAVEIGGYRMAWVGYAQHDDERRIEPQASAGNVQGYLDQISLSWSAQHPNGKGPSGRTVRSGKPVIINDLANDPGFVHWRALALQNGFHSMICLPLKRGGQVFGILALYQSNTHPISDEERQLLCELADNLAFGIDTLRQRIAQQRIQRAVLKIASAVSARSGEEFLDQLTHHMAEALDAELAFIARLDERDSTRANTLTIVIDGQRQPNFSYTLPGAPCEDVLIEAECIVHDEAGKRLPVEGREALTWVRAYAGRRLDNAAGEPMGLLGVMFAEPLQDTELVSSVLQIFAAGVAAELERQEDETRIRRLAYRDPGTGLPNRTAFMQRLEGALEAPGGARLGLMLLDLNRFKDINDTLGHDIGDKVLAAVANSFSGALVGNEYLARLGGDEFVVLAEPSDVYAITHTAERLLRSLAAPLQLDEQAFELDASIGIAFYPDDAGSARELLKHADIAMYQAKQQDVPFRFFEEHMGAALASRLVMAKRLAAALTDGGLSLHFQPQVDLASGCLVGAEVLCRWHDDELGTVSPAVFIPLAEERGMIVPLGNWVIDATCRQLAAWQAAGLVMPGQLAINVASRQFDDNQLIATLQRCCSRHGVAASQLGLELTESGFMSDPDQAVAITEALKRLGFGLSIDDFGTGYSSLAYLKRFAADKIKIDMSFVADMLQSDNDHTIVTTIIAMARSLKMETIAEGVEHAEQADALLALGCQQAQGYHFSKPLTGERFAERWLAPILVN
ncbi:diguanylate cyclase (GGDEF) domain-containing protein [Franzmannia pantelleriensis]|uniref:Diguanylate cyclase (GGDEF) domain-containing protein n=1 Tax=Franzmannia pantelleriensis TaxID=48727 RepID=A0A1G9VMG4_9GAMM|nr:EAL domain-containing protein [Halomonas pantelleriensis]SDM73384.1 diguanylate cyclase (GGDEF) domain-containing protein [Halomonas pantelleriensis]